MLDRVVLDSEDTIEQGCEAEAQEFTAEESAAVDAIIEKYKLKPGSLIPVLEEIQEEIGYLPKSVQKKSL